ncbi:MAG: class II aldolase/adducin family protein [Candidatus Omnitrophica bacterium]|nr:class II aldolase/adducin family protein [Candidatus Omnitrophota bacterium]
MIIDREKELKEEIINIGKQLYLMRLVVGKAGNLSARLDEANILVTATGAQLGDLKAEDIIKVNLADELAGKNKPVTSEFPLHSLIHKNFTNKVVIHCHPALLNGYFAVYSDIKALTFESKLYLGNIPVVAQDTPAVTKPELVIEALKLNNLAVLKNHGVVCIADNFKDALNLIETLEEAVKVAGIARLFKKDILDELDKELKESLDSEKAYPMFSKEHIQAIVDLVNKDEFIARKGAELDLTVRLAIKLDDDKKAYKFNFEKGKIVRLDADADAPFIISAPRQIWEQVFLGKLDSFVAVTQGKMKLEGQLGQLSKWYVPFTRLFELFKQVKFK